MKIIIITLVLLLFNNINSELKRPEAEPSEVSVKYLEMLHNCFLGKENQTNTFITYFGQYTIKMKFLNIKMFLEEEEIYIDPLIQHTHFSYINPYIEFILSLEVMNRNNNTNAPDDQVSIIYDSNRKEPILKFELKNVNSTINFEYIEFERNPDNTYHYIYYKDDKELRRIEILIDLEKFKYIPKIYNLLNNQREQLNKFLLNSFCSYLDYIIHQYPIPDGIYSYNEIVERMININTFALDLKDDKSLEKISINSFKEEKYIIEGASIIFLNIKTNFEITFKNTTKVNHNVVISKLYYIPDIFFFETIEYKIGKITLDKIFIYVIEKIIQEYLDYNKPDKE